MRPARRSSRAVSRSPPEIGSSKRSPPGRSGGAPRTTLRRVCRSPPNQGARSRNGGIVPADASMPSCTGGAAHFGDKPRGVGECGLIKLEPSSITTAEKPINRSRREEQVQTGMGSTRWPKPVVPHSFSRKPYDTLTGMGCPCRMAVYLDSRSACARAFPGLLLPQAELPSNRHSCAIATRFLILSPRDLGPARARQDS